jgi:nicotinic acetylcholine receptor
LKWTKELYGGVDEVRLPVSRIWTPGKIKLFRSCFQYSIKINQFFRSIKRSDIVLYNYADTRLEEKRDVLAIINSDGTVKWRPPSIFKSTCQINIQNFPYDRQNCSMKFGN